MTNNSLQPKQFLIDRRRAFAMPLLLLTALVLVAPLSHAASGSAGSVYVGLSVWPTEVSLGRSVTVTWNAQNANSCQASGAWSGTLYINGQEPLRPAQTGVLTYSISCVGPTGTATTSTNVTVTGSTGGTSSSSSGGSTSSSSSSSGGWYRHHGSSSSSSGSSSGGSTSSSSSSSGGSTSSSSSSGGGVTSSSSSSSGGHSSSSSSGGSTSSSSSSSSGGSTSSSSSSSSGGSSSGAKTAFIRQVASVTSPGQNALGDPQVLSLTVSLPQPVQVGSTILVFATEANGGNIGLPITVTDYLGNPFSKLDQVDDTSNAAWQSMFSFVAYNVPAGTEQVTVKYKQFEWQGVLVVEVAGVNSLPLIQHKGNVQRGTSTSPNAITSGLMTAGAVPGAVIGISQATLDVKGAPIVGTGFTASTSVWNWNGEENTPRLPSTLLEYQHFANPGDVAATFTAAASGDDWDTIAVFFPDAK